ncbi:MAG: hypothetical protein KGK04_11435, partial [Xanthomonadaceae bacterium]|nr:hypothetical protein [Xanthomonadaceae bacterium]
MIEIISSGSLRAIFDTPPRKGRSMRVGHRRKARLPMSSAMHHVLTDVAAMLALLAPAAWAE